MDATKLSTYVVFPAAEQIEVGQEPLPTPGTGELLCQAQTSLISMGTESYCLRGKFDPGTNWAAWVRYPFRPGYSMVARITAVGPGVEGFHEGDRVAVMAPHQQFFTVQPQRVHRIPAAISDEDATWMSLACTTQLGVRRAALALGETVGVVGLGMLGQLVVQYLSVSGARRIIAIDPVQERLEIARAHGATHTLALDVASAKQEIAAITGGKMLDAVFDITGHPAVLAHAIQLLRRLGRVILLGDTPTPTAQHLGPGVVSNSIAILGIHGSMSPPVASEFNPWTQHEMTELFFDYLQQGRMRVADLITDRHSPQEAPPVYQRLLRDRSTSIGIVFDWTARG